MNKFNIRDRVKIKTYEELPERMKTCAIARLAGKGAVINDRLYSEARDAYTYVLTVDGYDRTSSVPFPEEALDPIEPVSYFHEIEYLDNIVIAHFYEVRDGVKTELARGHGHIIHDDAYGVAQAAAYALTRIAKELNGGELRRRDEE